MGKISGYSLDSAPTTDDYIVTIDTTSGSNKKVQLGSLRAILATKRVNTIVTGSAPTPAGATTDIFTITALAVAATIAAPSGTPVDGQGLIIRIKDNGTSQTLAWNAIYRAIGVTLPTATTGTKTLYIGMLYNAADSVWDVISVGRQG